MSDTTIVVAKPKTVSELLERSLALLGPNGKNWKQGYWGFSPEGQELTPTDNRACFFCADGALQRTAYGVVTRPLAEHYESPEYIDGSILHSDARVVMATAALELDGSSIGCFIDYNDKPGRTFPEIKMLFEKAIELAKAKEAEVAVA